MPRVSRVLSCTAALVMAGGLSGAAYGLTAAQSAGAATSWPAHVFAPYVDTGLSNTTLTSVAASYGTKYFTLAFVNGGGCQWSLPNQSGWQSQISALQAQGGDVMISFGGYTVDTDSTDLGATCSSPGAMAAQVESVVSTLGVTHLDFDIESNELTNSADYTRTAQALAQVRSWASANGTQLTIAYTLPVLPTGLTQSGASVLSAAAASGFTPNIVNIMTMDYGSSGHRDGRGGEPGARRRGRPGRERVRRVRIGRVRHAGQHPDDRPERQPRGNLHPGRRLYRGVLRRREGHRAALLLVRGPRQRRLPGQTSASSTCSGLSQSTGAFTQAFQSFTSGGSGGGGGGGDGRPTPTPTPTPTTGSCAAAWSNATAYVSGNQVSYNGDNWTANQWNYNEVPGGASGAWNSNGAC